MDIVQDMCTDADGNVYIIGEFGRFSQYDLDVNYIYLEDDSIANNGANQIFLVKYSGSGNILWVKGIGLYNPFQNPATRESGHIVVFDPATNAIIISGIFSNNEVFVSKLDLNGNILWSAIISDGTRYLSNSSITTDSNGSIYIAGYSDDSVHFDQNSIIPPGGYIAKYGANGNFIWAKSKFIDSEPLKLKIVANDLYVLGRTLDDTCYIDTLTLISNGYNMFFSKMDTSGSLQWNKVGATSGRIMGADFDFDTHGNIYLTGSFSHDITFDGITVTSNNINASDMFIVKFDQNVNAIWLKQTNAINGTNPMQVKTTTAGNFYFSCDVLGNSSIILKNDTIGSVTSTFLVVACFDSSGYCLGYTTITGNPVLPFKLALDSESNFYVSCSFSGQIDIDSLTLIQSNYGCDLFIAKHDALVSETEKIKQKGNPLFIYPNPNSGICKIEIPDELQNENDLIVRVYDNVGKLVSQNPVSGKMGALDLNLRLESSGYYHISLSSNEKVFNGRVIWNK